MAADMGSPGTSSLRTGQRSHKNDDNKERQASGSGDKSQHRGGSGNFAEDREKASEAGRKGGQR